MHRLTDYDVLRTALALIEHYDSSPLASTDDDDYISDEIGQVHLIAKHRNGNGVYRRKPGQGAHQYSLLGAVLEADIQHLHTPVYWRDWLGEYIQDSEQPWVSHASAISALTRMMEDNRDGSVSAELRDDTVSHTS